MKRALAVIAAFTLGCGIVVGAAVAYYFLPAPGGDLADKPDETTYPVTLVDFADQRTLLLLPTFSAGSELRTAASGVVTSSGCVPGKALESGKAAFSVDGAPVVALSADVPFYRDLGWGDSGPDLDSLRRALATMGYSVATFGEFDKDVFDALSAIQRSEGSTLDDGLFHLADFLWMPTGVTAVESCEVKVGQSYMPGATFATTANVLASLSVVHAVAEDVVPGERTLRVFGVDVIVPENGVLNDPQTLARITASPEAGGKFTGEQESESASISATSELVTPVRVAPVPAASLFGTQGIRGCVASKNGTHAVTIVGTRLGMSQVTFDGDPPPNVLLQPDTETCSAG